MSENAKIYKSSKDNPFDMQDGLENLVAQLGTEQDKRAHSTFTNKKRLSMKGNEVELNALYRSDWAAGQIVDIIPDDMCREWREFTGDIEPEIITLLEKEESRLDLVGSFNLAHKWARLYGEGFIVLAVDDGLDPSEPLDIDNMGEGMLKHIKVIDRHRLAVTENVPVTNPLNPAYGFPEFYTFIESDIKIHHSRMLRFSGVVLPFDEFRRNNYFSDGVLDRVYDSLTNLATAADSSASMIYETNVDIVKVKGLMNYLQTEDGETLLRKRFSLAGLLKSFNNMLLLDNEEEFTSKTNAFSGLPELINKFTQLLSAAADIPATRLLGTSASGLNASGEGDLKNYYDKIRSEQVKVYGPKLQIMDRLLAANIGIDSGLDLSYRFKPLFQLSADEISIMQNNNAQRDNVYLTHGVLTPDIIAKELAQTDTYSNITQEYIEDLELFVDPEEFTNEDFNIKDPTKDPENKETEGTKINTSE